MELISKKGYEKLCEEYHSMNQKITDTQREMGESAKRINETIDFNGMKIIIKSIERI